MCVCHIVNSSRTHTVDPLTVGRAMRLRERECAREIPCGHFDQSRRAAENETAYKSHGFSFICEERVCECVLIRAEYIGCRHAEDVCVAYDS